MRLALVPLVLMLAACGGDGEEAGVPDAAQIERLSTPSEEKVDPLATTRLQPLRAIDLESEGLIGGGCEFRAGDVLLLAAVGSDALVRVGGELRHMVQSAPVTETGGFFEDRSLSVSIGRIQGAGDEGAGTWPARLTVTNRRTETEIDVDGTWSCRG